LKTVASETSATRADLGDRDLLGAPLDDRRTAVSRIC
jgi:hypothetical protein